MVESKGQADLKAFAYGLITFSLPLILSGILQQLYNWADAFIVGNVEGERALAAVGATTTVINFYLMAITGLPWGFRSWSGKDSEGGRTDSVPQVLSTFSVTLGVFFCDPRCGGDLVDFPPILHFSIPRRIRCCWRKRICGIIFLGIPFLGRFTMSIPPHSVEWGTAAPPFWQF